MARARLRPIRLANLEESSDGTVGYGQPPRDSRFQKGQSGNPAGRRTGSKNLKTVVVSSANAPVKEGGRRRNITKLEAALKALADKAAAGDPRAIRELVQMVQKFDGSSDPSESAPVLGKADQLVVEQLFVRIAAMTKGKADEDPNSR
jgi:hypothetical protein